MQGVLGTVTIVVILALVSLGLILTYREDRKLRRAEVKQERGGALGSMTPPPIPSPPDTTSYTFTPRNSQTTSAHSYQQALDAAAWNLPTQETREHILGWRVHHSLSGSWGVPWPTGFMVASCALRPSQIYGTCGDPSCTMCPPKVSSHSSPNLNCNCGIYSTFQPERTQAINVLVANSGTIIQHTRGYRSEQAQVIAYTVNTRGNGNLDEVDQMWSSYGIPKCRSVEKLQKVFDYFTRNPDALYDEVERLFLERQFVQPAAHPEGPFSEEMPF